MITAQGFGAWHNQYNPLPIQQCVQRALRAKLDFMIVKYGAPETEDAYGEAGIPWATERYVYAVQPKTEGNMLADAVDAGGVFAVINAEEGQGGWGPGLAKGEAMRTICKTFRERHPETPLYACLDTRGDRLQHAYQQVALKWCDGIIPMVYPGAFYPAQPQDYIRRAFEASIGGKDFQGQPIFPAIQSYGWDYPPGNARRLGRDGIGAQLKCVLGIRANGCQLYTIHHASDEEWDEVVHLREAGIPTAPPEPTTPPFGHAAAEKLLLEMKNRSEAVDMANHGRWAELHDKLHTGTD